jgi:dTDP-4-amino-4,6-dideoxygalactose transaminase
LAECFFSVASGFFVRNDPLVKFTFQPTNPTSLPSDEDSVFISKPYLPPLEEYTHYLQRVWASGQLTNNGSLVQQLEDALQASLAVPYVQYVTNGTVALQLALKALDLRGKIITTPYSYVATTNVILWENCRPVFVDIEPKTFCIDANQIESVIDEETTAILATHVYGHPCDVEKIAALAKKYDLKVIYDGAHAFGVNLDGVPLLQYGDVATLSFHATKVFHTVEGGAVISHDPDVNEKVFLSKAFGHRADNYARVGINGKNSEFHAAMGLCNLPVVQWLINQRKLIYDQYQEALRDLPVRTIWPSNRVEYNYAYFPVIFEDFAAMSRVKETLESQSIFPRRYFYPSLNQLPYHPGEPCPVAEDIAQRVLCLPFYHSLEQEHITRIITIIQSTL